MTRVGIIGCGGIARTHTTALKALPDIQVTGAWDCAAERAAAFSQETDVPAVNDWRQLLDSSDAIFLCTPPFAREEYVLGAAEAGKHIFMEKAISLDLATADRMIAATKKAGITFQIGYVLRFMQPFRFLRDTFASGELGKLVSCWSRRFMPFDTRGKWFNEQSNCGGITLEFGSHDIDWLRWIGGDVKTVFGTTERRREGVNTDEHAYANMLFADGGVGSVEVSWLSALSECSLGVIGEKGAIIVDRSGLVRKQLAGEKMEVLNAGTALDINPEGEFGGDEAKLPGETIAPSETIQEHFFRCIREGVEPITSADEARRTLQTVLAVRASAEQECDVAVADIA